MGMIGAMAQVTLNIVVSICCIGEDIPAPHTSGHYAFLRLEYSSLCGRPKIGIAFQELSRTLHK